MTILGQTTTKRLLSLRKLEQLVFSYILLQLNPLFCICQGGFGGSSCLAMRMSENGVNCSHHVPFATTNS
ncbi:transmembrane protein, putative [Medicago truncatula]|uniref:Transmembrane protein, putative n=1 Tax=Medicago truncatula TaxID=3880 RepID=A0A072UGE6_MEDTR|nr:transmembrane protein, putative [Medicago truncatula]